MKHWLKDGDYYNFRIDNNHFEPRVVSIIEDSGNVRITEECDRFFNVEMPKRDFIEALRELANELEVNND